MQFMSVLLNCLYAVYVCFTQLLVCISCSTVPQLYIDVQFICVPVSLYHAINFWSMKHNDFL